MGKLVILLLLCCGLLSQCGTPITSGGGGGGGASETVATVTPEDSSIRVRVTGDKPFTVAVTVCSDHYSLIDSTFFHASSIITTENPEWIVPTFTDQRVNVLLTNTVDGKAALIVFERTAWIKDPLPSPLGTTGTIEGVVTEKQSDGTTRLAGGASVVVKGTLLETKTDQQGNYRIDKLPAGRYVLDAFITTKSSNHYSLDTHVDISGDTTAVCNFSL